MALREGETSDWPLVRTLMRRSLEDDTYVNADVWKTWTDGDARTILAEEDGRVVGVGAMTRLSEASWWMEGPIAHPDVEGQGVANQILEPLIADFGERGSGILRTATFSDDELLVNTLEEHGFIHIVNYMRMEGATRPGDFGHYDPLMAGDIELTMMYLQASPMFKYCGFFERGNLLNYMTTERTQVYLGNSSEVTLAWTQWDTISGMVMMDFNPDPPNHDAVYINFLDAMDDTTIKVMLDSIRAAGHRQGKTRFVWKMPIIPGLDQLADSYDWEAVWSVPLKVYELPVEIA